MDLFADGSRGERNIEDYLFGDYERTVYKSTFASDQQFARPIEDEDLFGDLQSDSNSHPAAQNTSIDSPPKKTAEDQSSRGPFSAIGSDLINKENDAGSPRKSLDDCQENAIQSIDGTNQAKSGAMDIDDIFLNDYSDASKGSCNQQLNGVDSQTPQRQDTNQNQTYSRNLDTNPDRRSGMSHLNNSPLLKRIKEQALARGLIPKKIEPDADGFIEIEDEPGQQSRPTTKFMFNKFISANKNSSPFKSDKGKLTWNEYKDTLLKKLHADKRKIWDSFQAPCDSYDENEELIEETSPKEEDLENNLDSDVDHDEVAIDESAGDEESQDDEQSSDEQEDEPVDQEDADAISVDSDDARLRSKSGRQIVIVESDEESDTSMKNSILDLEAKDSCDSNERIRSSYDNTSRDREFNAGGGNLSDKDASMMAFSDESDFDEADDE